MDMSASKSASESLGHCKTRMYRTCAYQSVWRWAKAFRHLYPNVGRLSFLRSDGQGLVKRALERKHVLPGTRRQDIQPSSIQFGGRGARFGVIRDVLLQVLLR